MPAKIETLLGRMDRVKEIARFMADTRAVLFLGRHVGYPIALEGALKLKELAYIHAEGFAAGELKHGPIALIEPGQPVFVIVPSPTREHGLHAKVVSNIQEIRARGARTLVIAEEGDEAVLPVRRRGDLGPARRRRCSRRCSRSCRCRSSRCGSRRPRASTSTSRATSPSRSRSSDHRGRDRRRRHRALRARRSSARLRCASGSSPRRSAVSASPPSRPASPPRRRSPSRSAHRRACTGPTRGSSPTTTASPRWRSGAPCSARANDLGVDSLHVSLSHDAGVASAVVIAEG